jgi:glycosyltransferase involved in cell wall biosynthesis
MTVSVIMPAFNGGRWIGDQLTALAAQTYTGEWELIVADNGSTDDTCAIAARWADRFPSLRIIDASSVRGVSHARNQGALAASSDVLLITDVDDVVRPNWIELLAGALTRSSIVTGPDAHFVDGKAPRTDLVPDRHAPSNAGPFPYPVGCNMGIDRSVLSQLGWFDETLTRGSEDIDLGIRAALHGYTIGWVDDAVVFRRRPGSVRAMWRKEFTYGRGWTNLERRYPQLVPNGWVRPLLRRTTWVAVRAPYVLLANRRRGWIVRAASVAGRLSERLSPST